LHERGREVALRRQANARPEGFGDLVDYEAEIARLHAEKKRYDEGLASFHNPTRRAFAFSVGACLPNLSRN
jgi:hypothetical protein